MVGSIAEWLACWTQAQKAWVQITAATLLGNSLRQTVHTRCASFHQAAKLIAVLLRVARVTAGLAESNGSLLPGLVQHTNHSLSRHAEKSCSKLRHCSIFYQHCHCQRVHIPRGEGQFWGVFTFQPIESVGLSVCWVDMLHLLSRWQSWHLGDGFLVAPDIAY